MNLTDPILSDRRVRLAIGYAVDRQAIVTYLRRNLAQPAVGIIPPMSWAFEPGVFQFTHDPAKARALLDEAGYRDPDGDGPLPRLRLTAQDVHVRGVSLAGGRHSAESRGRRHRARRAVVGVRVNVRRRSERRRAALHVAMGWRDRSRYAAPRLPLDADAPVGVQSRPVHCNPRVDELIDQAPASRDEQERRRLYGEAERIIAADAPCISLWYKSNVAIFQRGLRGVSLNPIADLAFLKDVSRVP